MYYTYDPYRQMVSLSDAMNRLFRESYVSPQTAETSTWAGTGSVPVDVQETAEAFVVTAELPGWKPEDVKISLQGESLTISGQYRAPEAAATTPTSNGKQSSPQQVYHLRERTYRSFTRSFTLPTTVNADTAQAHFEHGILTLTLPKAESARPKQIPITTGAAVATGDKKLVEAKS
jgi:HSP20 family protein